MPSEHCDTVGLEQPISPQIKLCSDCHRPLSPESVTLLHPHAAIVCTQCRERIYAAPTTTKDHDSVKDIDCSLDFIVPLQDHVAIEDVAVDMPMPYRTPSPTPSLSPSLPAFSPVSVLALPISAPSHHQEPQFTPPSTPPSHAVVHPGHVPSNSDPNPRADISYLRVRSHSQDCLYPGAMFSGTQKSGRSSYEVSVTIVDVDFSSSFLCGYLRIRGLTDDWPELTTYFDAEIIGSRYGFITDNWGASETEDMTHWGRFPAFHRVKSEIRGPRHTMRERARDCVFMRWKERFLVPDHRVRDINGASFAGFYYVCVEFNPDSHKSHTRSKTTAEPPDVHTKSDVLPLSPSASTATSLLSDDSSWDSDMELEDDTQKPGTASMSGYYFHQQSEPYQQLSLRHVPRESSGSFEFR
ncbi:vacuolar import and degradation protein-domain-containing protein [Hysterangium stoloniferum]|nr:vacuolar import and degradation protein-domain-containing protein [Hysterangium stoloniferum]